MSKYLHRFHSWFFGLDETTRYWAFVLATFGWMPFMFFKSVILWCVGYTWFVSAVLFYLSLHLKA